jgi:hypothetical protein
MDICRYGSGQGVLGFDCSRSNTNGNNFGSRHTGFPHASVLELQKLNSIKQGEMK